MTGAVTGRHPSSTPSGRPRPTAGLLLAVALGGAVGAVLRWAIGEAWPHGDGFPWATLVVNATGSFALGLLPALALVRARPALAAGLGPGLLGGFTTLSAYAEEGRALWSAGDGTLAGSYLLGTLVACLAAVALARRLTGGPS